MSKYICNPKDFEGNFVKEVDPVFIKQKGRKSLTAIRQVELICKYCSKNFTVALNNAKRTRQKYCSISCSKAANFYFGIPNEKHPLYSRWLSMKQRCFNPVNINFKWYGGRGISVEPYLLNFRQYVEYLTSLPNSPRQFPSKLQIDRIDNNGHYERGNLRWVSASTNMTNTCRPKKVNHKDKYIGVNWSTRQNKFAVRLRHNKKLYWLGWFDNELEGAKVREHFIKKHQLPNRLNNV